MKIIILICKFNFLCAILFAQNSNWIWASANGGSMRDEGYSVCNDAEGNIYVTGYFQSSFITLGSYNFTNSSYNSGYPYLDMYLEKFDNNGNIIWAKKIGGSTNEVGLKVYFDPSGFIYLIGYFDSPIIIFDSDTLINHDPCSKCFGRDVFLTKFDLNGNVLWAKNYGGCDDDFISSICSDSNGNIIITGAFDSPTINFDLFSLHNSDTTGTVNKMFIAKLNNQGNTIWVREIYGDKAVQPQNVCSDGSNIFISANYRGRFIKVDTLTLLNLDTSGYASDIFFVKLNTQGDFLWTRKVNAFTGYPQSSIIVQSAITDKIGNIYFAGTFTKQSINFGSFHLANHGMCDLYVAKFNNSGNILWAKNFGGSNIELDAYLCADNNNNIYMTGSFASQFIGFGSDTLYNIGDCDIYLAKLNELGNVQWAEIAGGNLDDRCYSISSDIDGNIFLTGSFNSQNITFGTNILLNNNFDTLDIFVAKHSPWKTGIDIIYFHKRDIKFYPNPVCDILRIENIELNNKEITIFSLLNQRIKTCTITNNEINLTELPNGLFFLKVNDNNDYSFIRFIKLNSR